MHSCGESRNQSRESPRWGSPVAAPTLGQVGPRSGCEAGHHAPCWPVSRVFFNILE